VIAADRDRVPLRDALGAESHQVGDQAEVRLRREDPFLLGDVFLEDVVLERAAELGERDALLRLRRCTSPRAPPPAVIVIGS
jgi:hypothetical protein